MLKLVGANEDGAIADEKVLITDDNKPTAFLIGIALIEIVCDVTLACILAKTVFKKQLFSNKCAFLK